jgi:hypothetical protein
LGDFLGGKRLWEESIVLISAGDVAAAQQAAEAIGRNSEQEYESATGDRVVWRFYAVDRVVEVLSDTLEDGTEIFSRFLKEDEALSLLQPFEGKEG